MEYGTPAAISGIAYGSLYGGPVGAVLGGISGAALGGTAGYLMHNMSNISYNVKDGHLWKIYYNLLNRATKILPNDPKYNEKMSQCIEDLKYLDSQNIDKEHKYIRMAVVSSNTLQHPNIKRLLIKSGVDVIGLYPENEINDIRVEDQGFLARLGNKGNQLWNFLTSGSTAGNITAVALAAAGLAGVYYLYKKWKQNGIVTNNDKAIAGIIDQNSSKKNLNESNELQYAINYGKKLNRINATADWYSLGLGAELVTGIPGSSGIMGLCGLGAEYLTGSKGYMDLFYGRGIPKLNKNNYIPLFNIIERVNQIPLHNSSSIYNEKMLNCINDLIYLKKYDPDLYSDENILRMIDSETISNPNVKRLLIKGGIDVTGLYPENEINDIMVEDKGFLARLGNKGNQLWNFLTSGSTAGNITTAALAAAGLYGAYYLYKKWKQNKKIDEKNVIVADSIDNRK